MTTLNLEPGEDPVRIIDSEDATRTDAWSVEVGSGPVRISHERTTAVRRNGETLQRDQKHRLSNLRGEQLWAVAVDEPTTLRITPAGVDARADPTGDVRVIEGDIDADVTVDDVGISDVDFEGGSQTDDLSVTVTENGRPNRAGVDTFEMTVDTATDTLPSVVVPDGYDLTLKASVENDAPILIDGTFPLNAGGGLTVGVSNADNVSVASDSGTQTLYGVVEV